jgi:uncharacterized CHY-type Zn-finger protein
VAGLKGSTTEVQEDCSSKTCGECKKMMGRNEEEINCELCRTLFHGKCKELADVTF